MDTDFLQVPQPHPFVYFSSTHPSIPKRVWKLHCLLNANVGSAYCPFLQMFLSFLGIWFLAKDSIVMISPTNQLILLLGNSSQMSDGRDEIQWAKIPVSNTSINYCATPMAIMYPAQLYMWQNEKRRGFQGKPGLKSMLPDLVLSGDLTSLSVRS